MRFVKTAESIFDIPSGFTRVEFLESTGTQYIDTGVNGDSDKTYNMSFYVPSNEYNAVLGSWKTTDITCRFTVINGSNSALLYFRFNALEKTYRKPSDAFVLSAQCTKNSVTVNGSILTYEEQTFNTENSIFIFGVNRGSSQLLSVSGTKCYYCKIYDNDTLVRDFIPCIDPLGRACMYDLVGKKAYYNQGTGEFTVGRKIIPVEYLESTGTQYIDTGYKASSNIKVDLLYEPVSNINTNAHIFGARVNALAGNGFGIGIISSKFVFDYMNRVTASGVSIGASTKYRIVKDEARNNIYVNDMSVFSTANPETEFSLQQTMWLFKLNGAVATTTRYDKIYYTKVWDNGVLVRDFIPCKDENNIGFMFDTLSNTVYENEGTGAFVVGQNKYKMKLRLIKDNVLPTGYTQVEYMESSGTQWIDTGINPENANTSQVDIETNFAILTPSSDQYIGIFGAAVPRFGFYTRYNNMCFGYYQAHDNIHEIEYGKKYNLRFSVTKGSQNATLDGVTVWSETRTGTLQNTYTIGMFCRNYSTPQWINNARIYNLTIAIDGALVRNFIPALDPIGTPCMYDLVTRTPFYNQGTGTFSTGKPVLPMVRFIKDIIPREYAAVNYIASANGNQYINTRYTGNSATRVIIGASSSLESSNIPLFGARDTNGYYNSFSIWQNTGSNGMRFDYTDTTANVVYSHTWLTTGVNIIEKNGRYNYVNGVQVNSNTEKTFSCNNPFYLMAIDTSGIAMNGFVGSVSFCKIYENNTLVRNFIPVVRRIDKVAGMWDTITKQFFGNSGTGTFNYG